MNTNNAKTRYYAVTSTGLVRCSQNGQFKVHQFDSLAHAFDAIQPIAEHGIKPVYVSFNENSSPEGAAIIAQVKTYRAHKPEVWVKFMPKPEIKFLKWLKSMIDKEILAYDQLNVDAGNHIPQVCLHCGAPLINDNLCGACDGAFTLYKGSTRAEKGWLTRRLNARRLKYGWKDSDQN